MSFETNGAFKRQSWSVATVSLFTVMALSTWYLFGPAYIRNFTFSMKDYLQDEFAYYADETAFAKLEPQSIPFVLGIANHPIVKTYIEGFDRPVGRHSCREYFGKALLTCTLFAHLYD